jgi:hypothetical protein
MNNPVYSKTQILKYSSWYQLPLVSAPECHLQEVYWKKGHKSKTQIHGSDRLHSCH